jgi:hypothetical protein
LSSYTIEKGGTILTCPYVVTLNTGDGTFDVTKTLHMITPVGASRNFNPSGTFLAGHEVTVMNLSASQNLVFDSAGLNYTIAPNKTRKFIYTGASWVREDGT